MKPVFQTRFGAPSSDEAMSSPPGNCWAACIASILECQLEALPDETSFWKPGMKPMESWRPYCKTMHSTLALSYKVLLVQIRPEAMFYEGSMDTLNAYCIVGLPSPRNKNSQHAVVGKMVKGSVEIVHDPYPNGSTVYGTDYKKWLYEFFIKPMI